VVPRACAWGSINKKLDILIEGFGLDKEKIEDHEERITKIEVQMAL